MTGVDGFSQIAGLLRGILKHMHAFARFSLKNRALIALVTIVASVFGFLSMTSLKQELMPSIQFPAVVVMASYPGASPEVVNNDVSEPIELALRSVTGLEATTATSSTGSSLVLAEFEYGIDLAVTEQRVERAISRISQFLPEGVDPQVMSGSLDDFPVIQIAVTPPEGVDTEDTARLVDRIALPEISDLDGVREAELIGARGDRITIAIDHEALAREAVSSQAIATALQQSGVLIAAGTVTEEEGTLAVQAGSRLESVDDIATLPISRDTAQVQARIAAGDASAAALLSEPLTIADVAAVSRELNPETNISRVNGKPALTIAVTKLSSANTVDVSHAVQAVIEELESTLGGAELTIIFDQAPYVERSIETLTTEGLLGLLFAVLIILVFLFSVRATIVTAISIPVSILLTFVGLNFADYTLNMLTLGALTISIGRVVDDSIVVIENIKRHLAQMPPSADRRQTIVRAVREVGGAITASTATSAAVFLPMAFVSGMVGELFGPFAFTATIALAASLFVALTIVPVLAFWFLRDGKRPRVAEVSAAAASETASPGETASVSETTSTSETASPTPRPRPTALQRGYLPIVKWTLKHPAITLLVAAMIFGGTVAATPLLKTNFIGSDEQNSIGLTQTLAPGTSLEAQLEQAERVEAVLAEIDSIEMVQVTLGESSGLLAIFGAGGEGVVSYSITTDPDASQEQLQDQIRESVDALENAGEFAIGLSDSGITLSSSIEVNVTAPDQETLAEASAAVVAALQQQDRLIQVESDLAQSRPYLAIEVDRSAAAELGYTETALAGFVAQRMQPSRIGQIMIENSSIGIYLSQGAAPHTRAEVAALQIPTATGEVRLDSLAKVDIVDGPVTVRTENTNRMVTVSALAAIDDLGVAGADVEAALASVELPPGATAGVGGVMSQQAEAFEQLGIALLVAILLVFVIMVATFKSLIQPFLLLISVPFAATGALLLLLATGIPLGVASLIGLLMLIGIVVTNAIVLIDLVNQLRDRGVALQDAVLEGAALRLRPIIMTALATIFALVPMSIGITGQGGFISQPLGVVVIGGLLSSTVLTLVVLPTLYFAVERRLERWRERANRGS